ncbi:MAG: bifunctional aspartate kinase/homoserine dehydrogenase I, partial [Chitinophagaceae bacterium]
MQVLKFGGSSVANASNIKKVIDIVEQQKNAGTSLVVVSALGGITDLLLEACQLASDGNEQYKEQLDIIEQRHLQAVRELIPITNQSAVLSFVKTHCNEMEDICNGIFLLKELSARTKDRMAGFGELLSSKIIAAAIPGALWTDAASLIKTDNSYGNAVVDFATTNKNISDYFSSHAAELYLAPGFVATDAAGISTTLGRGGSDYSAAIFAAAT